MANPVTAPPAEVPLVPGGLTLGGCADELYRLRQERLAAQQVVDALKHTEEQLRTIMIRALGEARASAVAGRVARAGLTTERVGTIKDFDALRAHVVATGDLALFQRRLSDAYLRDLWEAGQEVPGVGAFTIVKVSLTKV